MRGVARVKMIIEPFHKFLVGIKNKTFSENM